MGSKQKHVPNVLIVGGGTGIGRHVTEMLIKQYAARVVVVGLQIENVLYSLQKSTGEDRLQLLKGDATSPEQRESMLSSAHQLLGQIDAFICTMGTLGEIQKLEKLSPEKLQQTYDVNLFAPVLMTQLLLPELRKSHGRIIILSSAVDKKVMYSGWIPYCSSKAALTRFIEVLAHEERDIRVYGVYPGLTNTAMGKVVLNGDFDRIMHPEEIQKFVDWERKGEMDPPQWCATAVARLVVGEADLEVAGKVQYFYEYDSTCKRELD